MGNSHGMNIDFGISMSQSLPPSTGNDRSISITRIESRFNSIASSISDLARHQAVHLQHLINDDIIATIENKLALESINGNQLLIDAITEIISGLQNELIHSKLLSERISTGFSISSSDATSIPSLFASKNDESSRSDTFLDRRPSIHQRHLADG